MKYLQPIFLCTVLTLLYLPTAEAQYTVYLDDRLDYEIGQISEGVFTGVGGILASASFQKGKKRSRRDRLKRTKKRNRTTLSLEFYHRENHTFHPMASKRTALRRREKYILLEGKEVNLSHGIYTAAFFVKTTKKKAHIIQMGLHYLVDEDGIHSVELSK